MGRTERRKCRRMGRKGRRTGRRKCRRMGRRMGLSKGRRK
jgi:hypothetical protein